jgi:hypothetical protein
LSPIKQALDLYGADFARIHGIYSEYGYCYSEPDQLVLFRPCREAEHETWTPLVEADAWWVELAIGDGALPYLISRAPHYLPRIGWAREFKGRPQPRFYDFNRLKQTLTYGLH